MTIFKPLLSLTFVLFCLSAFGQSGNDVVSLKWKIKPGETLIYKTVMNEVDTANHKDPDMTGMVKSLNKMTGVQDTSVVSKMNQLMKQLSKGVENTDLITQLTEKRKGIVDIEMLTFDNDTVSQSQNQHKTDSIANIANMLRKMAKGTAAARGAVFEDGGIASFYLSNGQRNLISLFFELPHKSIKPGESWSLDIHLLSFDQNFHCDSSSLKNSVTLKSVDVVNNEHIANIEYDILEYADGNMSSPFSDEAIKTMMKMTYRASAKFSIERGRWIYYDGLMSVSSTGMMSVKSTKKFSLVTQ